jgi:hypothetical protein
MKIAGGPAMSKKSTQGNNSNNTIDILIIFVACLVIFLIWQSRIFEMPSNKLIALIKNSLYLPHYNTFNIGQILNINVLAFFYAFLLLTIFIVVTYFTFFTDQKAGRPNPLLSQVVATTGIIGLLLFTGVQQIRRIDYFAYEINKFGGKSTDEKILGLFGAKYQFSKICQKVLKGPHQGEWITDFDLSKSPYMFDHRLMSYYLYPKLSMRFDNKSPVDCLVLYSDKNALDQVPEHYKALVTVESAKYILAIREKEK